MRSDYVHVGHRYRLTDSIRFGMHAGKVGKVVALVERRNGIAFVWECEEEHHVVVRSHDLHDVEDATSRGDLSEGRPVSNPTGIHKPPLPRWQLTLVRWARTGLVIVAVGAVAAFVVAAWHGFRSTSEICFSYQKTCGNNPTWNARTLAWLAPLVFVGAIIALSVLKWLSTMLVARQL